VHLVRFLPCDRDGQASSAISRQNERTRAKPFSSAWVSLSGLEISLTGLSEHLGKPTFFAAAAVEVVFVVLFFFFALVRGNLLLDEPPRATSCIFSELLSSFILRFCLAFSWRSWESSFFKDSFSCRSTSSAVDDAAFFRWWLEVRVMTIVSFVFGSWRATALCTSQTTAAGSTVTAMILYGESCLLLFFDRLPDDAHGVSFCSPHQCQHCNPLKS